jgi:hypothetical protein
LTSRAVKIGSRARAPCPKSDRHCPVSPGYISSFSSKSIHPSVHTGMAVAGLLFLHYCRVQLDIVARRPVPGTKSNR